LNLASASIGRQWNVWLAAPACRFRIDTYTHAQSRAQWPLRYLCARRRRAWLSAPSGIATRRLAATRRSPFGKAIDYRDAAIVGDIKYLWEPSRHLQLVTLAQAWHLTHEPRYAMAAARCSTPVRTIPYLMGVHVTSSLEHAIRLLNWSFAWHLLAATRRRCSSAAGKAFRTTLAHQRLSTLPLYRRHFSRFSSANNHLLGELAGLFVAATTWPLWKQSQRWQRRAQEELVREALKQTTSDGVIASRRFGITTKWPISCSLPALVARANGPISAPYWRRLETMLEFLASIMDSADTCRTSAMPTTAA